MHPKALVLSSLPKPWPGSAIAPTATSLRDVPLPELTRRAAEKEVGRLCNRRSPSRVRDQLRTEYHIRGNNLTVCETRPPWRLDDSNREWTHYGAAQLRYRDGVWTLYWSDRNGKWHVYDLVEPTADLRSLIDVVDHDPVHIFWG